MRRWAAKQANDQALVLFFGARKTGLEDSRWELPDLPGLWAPRKGNV